MVDNLLPSPNPTAVRVALLRALHVLIDEDPIVFNDTIGLKIVSPDNNWQMRPDMHAENSKPFRASIVGRSRFIEELVLDQINRDVTQYVILGAGFDTFAFRHKEILKSLTIFEVDHPDTQNWKRQRIIELGIGEPDYLRFVPVDFEAGENWLKKLLKVGFDATKPAVVSSAGVSMYISKEANSDTLRKISTFASGSIFAMTFILPIENVDNQIKNYFENAIKDAQENNTPLISFFKVDEIMKLAQDNGFKLIEHISSQKIANLYFEGRTDSLIPAANTEELLLVKI